MERDGIFEEATINLLMVMEAEMNCAMSLDGIRRVKNIMDKLEQLPRITGPLLKEASGSIAGTAIPPIDEYWDMFAVRVRELLREK